MKAHEDAPLDSYGDPNVERGRLFIVSAPSGAGKTTLCHALLDRFYEVVYSVSSTTRKPRVGERDGVDYHFISLDEFKKGIRDGLWAEWAEVHTNYYGTSAAYIEENLANGSDVLLDIDVQGAIQIMERYPGCETIFIMPPSMEELKNRLLQRGTDSPRAIERRLKNAEKEMAARSHYKYVVVNDQLEKALDELTEIFTGDRG